MTPTAAPTTLSSPVPGAGSLATMAGETAPPPDQAQPDQASQLRLLIDEVRQMDMRVTELAKQFPSAASAARQASSGLKALLREIVANAGPEPASPEMQ